MEYRPPPQLGDTGDVGQLVDQAAGRQQPLGVGFRAVCELHDEAAIALGDPGGRTVANLDGGIHHQLVAADRSEIGGRHAVSGEEIVDGSGGCVTGVAGVQHQNASVGAVQGQCGEARRPG